VAQANWLAPKVGSHLTLFASCELYSTINIILVDVTDIMMYVVANYPAVSVWRVGNLFYEVSSDSETEADTGPL